jgi:hypothetical protein
MPHEQEFRSAKTSIWFRPLLVVLWFCPLEQSLYADAVTLKDGSQVSGRIESGGTREIRIETGTTTEMIAVDRIQSIQFEVGTPLQPRTLPAGAKISIRTTDPIDSKTADEHKEYLASLDAPVVVNGVTVIPAKATAYLRVQVTKPRLMSLKTASLSLRLVAFSIGSQRVAVNTDQIQSKAASHAARDVAAGAGGGALIGVLTGGGWGLLWGTVIGGGGGYVYEKITGHVKIPSETRFTYTLPEPLVITYEATR